ncbi:MAG: hypothetical protein M3N24_08460, partial [Actinomycetota bacterium]|nr:hypothetical protein [Actinomycetota bacterium]
FILPERRRRYLNLVQSNAHGRKKFLSSLDHFYDLDSRFCNEVERPTAAVIESALRSKGAPDECVVLSQMTDAARTMALHEAIQTVWDERSGAIVSCIPSRLAYFLTKDGYEHWICERS